MRRSQQTQFAKVDNAPSTRLILDGQKPAQFAPALQGKHIKRDIIREEKKKAYPAGLGVTGAYQLYREDLEKPIDDGTSTATLGALLNHGALRH
ncbi:hypothetical protein B0H10DRAFT_2215989 [Mycena sp. CBHHK59/15]|nr:hypothetical protein B0H10DRAFT_2215989 [Mycena sp. CBHHK59/15]